MSLSTKNKNTSRKKKGLAIVDKSVGNYENHPFFKKKAAEAKEILKRAGLPQKVK